MKNQTYILSVWCGADRYDKAENCNRSFFRFSCKKAKTVESYLIGYIEEANGYEFLYPFFFAEDGKYMIEETPDGYSTESIVKIGFINELKQ
ncbi:hypothetical protein [Bacteroides fluxus]|uniref:hypothetical protein n=1 Tax=Bacteroides fluxus TaxID=626930 RepID=UPI0023A831AF|nr:hypothetical protein [Bacteroides fluxus]